MSARRNIDWDAVEDLGRVSDATIAARLGVSSVAVLVARKRRGIQPSAPGFRGRGKLPPDLAEALELDAADLGITLDELVVGCLRDQFGVVAP